MREVLDLFIGPNEQLAGHSPDEAPAPPGAVGWNANGAYSNDIASNRLVAGGNDGAMKYAQLYQGRHDRMTVLIDALRQVDLGADIDIIALVLRAKEVAGNNPPLDWVQFYTERQVADVVTLNYTSVLAGAPQDVATALSTLAWAKNTGKRLALRVQGSTIRLYTGPYGGGAMTLAHTATLVIAPLNDADHDYVGLGLSHYTECAALTRFEAGQLGLVIAGGVASFTRLRGAVNQVANIERAVDSGFADAPTAGNGFALPNLALVDAAPAAWLTAALSAAVTPAVLSLILGATSSMIGGLYSVEVEVTGDEDASPAPGAALTVELTIEAHVFVDGDDAPEIEGEVVTGNVGTRDIEVEDEVGALTINGGANPVTLAVTAGAAWLSFAVLGDGSVRLTFNAAALEPDTYEGELTFTLPAPNNTPLVVPVTLTVIPYWAAGVTAPGTAWGAGVAAPGTVWSAG